MEACNGTSGSTDREGSLGDVFNSKEPAGRISRGPDDPAFGLYRCLAFGVGQRDVHLIANRKALGAKERDIWGQFLIDSALLTFAGGIIGVAVGWGGSYVISQTGAMQTLVTSDIVALAVGVSIGIGLFFGFYPAWQGSRLDPIQALRAE